MEVIDDRIKAGDIVYLRGHWLVPMVVTRIPVHSDAMNIEIINCLVNVAWLDKEDRPHTSSYPRECLYVKP